MSSKQAIVFLTHLEVECIYHHFLRLRAETRDLLDVFLCVHQPKAEEASGRLRADFRVTSHDEAQLFPTRYMEKLARGGTNLPGFADLAYVPALLSPRLSSYQYIWFVEYDVDYAGNWSDFFMQFRDSSSDLLGTTLFAREQCPGWYHWSWFVPPPQVATKHHIRSFLPIARFSRRMLIAFIEAVHSDTWRGHSEALAIIYLTEFCGGVYGSTLN